MKRHSIITLIVASLAGLAVACHQPVPVAARGKQHLVEMKKNDAVLYIDTVASNRVIREEQPGTASAFVTYKIGMENSLPMDAKRERAWLQYFEYNMSSDWKALINGDSVSPAFFHPVVRLSTSAKEGILVFELPAGGKQPDTLVYSDSFGLWEKQIIALNQNNK